jgi:DNA-binding transcriptional LysR family regulator
MFGQKGDKSSHGAQVGFAGLAGKGGCGHGSMMIDKLEMFIALARERHFGRAAAACGVTQPSLSGAIRQLEDQLGVQLVFRGSRFQGLTPEGQRVLDRARGIVGDVRALRDEMRVVRAGLSGNLRLGVIPTALPMVADLTGPFIARHPNVRASILSRTSAEILTGIDSLELDAGITYLDNEPLGRVAQVPLYSEFYRFVCAPVCDLAMRSKVTWAEVAGQRLCLLTSDMQNRRIVDQHLADAGTRVVLSIESNSSIALISHVLTGQWASVVPKGLADMFAADGKLVSVPIVEPEAEHLVGLIAPKRDPQTPVLQAFIEEAIRLGGR